ncbi:AMIN domain-containing protein [Cystobacter fuscus]|uniref:AMIN domain-containing protein n=1 Tax=Cystobacter fuscus TaxID=43 RepID=A0A250J366_9BACT|nr:AMIN domain-containing protein [Cystobacter fuscus]ATB37811.1 AMIN domain-containing protein [Cystobacter fuscus]
MRSSTIKSSPSAFVLLLITCVLGSARALAQESGAGNLNSISSVNVRGGTVEIVGTKKPNFTTFTLTDPPRLVIDISEAVFSGVKEDITVGNGTITAIRTASYGSDESAIARVLIGYEREVDTDIQARGNSLVVSVAGGTAAQAAAPSGPAPTTDAAPAATGTDTQQAGASAQAAQEEQKRQEAAAAQAAQAAQEERKRQELAAAQAAEQEQAEARRQAEARAAAERKTEEERAQQERATQAAEKQRQQEEARAAADARRESEAQASEAKRRQAAEDRARRESEAQAAAEERRRQQEEAREARAARVAQAETPRREPARQEGPPSVSSRRKTMTLVGFKQERGASRVFVRTNEPVRYSVSPAGDKLVVVELENTVIAEENNTRAMDTSFFNTAVASVDANPGPSRSVRVSIRLKQQVPYETRQEGNELSIEFQRPASR